MAERGMDHWTDEQVESEQKRASYDLYFLEQEQDFLARRIAVQRRIIENCEDELTERFEKEEKREMPVEIITMEDCASNYGVFQVKGSKGDIYTVSFNGSEGPAHCDCKAGQHNRPCKHVKEVWDKACMYNPQWHDSNENPELRPFDYTYHAFTKKKCECGGPLVAVRRAV